MSKKLYIMVIVAMILSGLGSLIMGISFISYNEIPLVNKIFFLMGFIIILTFIILFAVIALELIANDRFYNHIEKMRKERAIKQLDTIESIFKAVENSDKESSFTYKGKEITIDVGYCNEFINFIRNILKDEI